MMEPTSSRMGRPSQGRSERIQAMVTPEIKGFLGAQQKEGESASDVVFRILERVRLKAPQPKVSQVACFTDRGTTEYVHPQCIGPKYNHRTNGIIPVNQLESGTRCAECHEEIDRDPWHS